MADMVLPFTLPFTLEAAPAREPTKAKAAASWDWLLCDGNGNPLAELVTATGKQLTFKRNYYSEAQFTISHEDAAAYPLLEAVAKGPMPTLRCYRRGGGESQGVLRFNGYLAPFSETLEESKLITATFRSPFGRLVGDGGAQNGRYIGVGLTTEGEKYADDIAASLIKLYGGAGKLGEADPTFSETIYEGPQAEYPIGLKIGNLQKTQLRFVSYKYANVGQAIIYLSQMLNGFDFDETFVEEGATLAYFNTYGRLGENQPTALFEYGPGTLANVRRVERTTSSPLNFIRLMGSSGIVAETKAEMAESLAAYGLWFSQQQAIGTVNPQTLEARALGLRRPLPVKTIVIAPDISLESCPKPWDDFFIGDTIQFYGRAGAFQENLALRVNELQVVIDDNGFEASVIPAPDTVTGTYGTDTLHTTLGTMVETGSSG